MSDDLVMRAHAFIRGHTTADLRFDDSMRPVRYVIAPDGRPVTSVMVAMLLSYDTVLFVPQCEDGALEIGVTLEEIDDAGDAGEMTDRWRIYHGDPEDTHWAIVHIDAARYEDSVIDGEALIRPNPLAGEEAVICREMNDARRDDLRRLCAHYRDLAVEDPKLVGVDPLGFDVRGRFDVVRIASPEPMETAEDVRRMLERMRSEAAEDA